MSLNQGWVSHASGIAAFPHTREANAEVQDVALRVRPRDLHSELRARMVGRPQVISDPVESMLLEIAQRRMDAGVLEERRGRRARREAP